MVTVSIISGDGDVTTELHAMTYEEVEKFIKDLEEQLNVFKEYNSLEDSMKIQEGELVSSDFDFEISTKDQERYQEIRNYMETVTQSTQIKIYCGTIYFLGGKSFLLYDLDTNFTYI